MQIFIFITYFIFFSWLVSRVPFNHKSGLPAFLISGLFAFKVLMGCLYGWVHSFPTDYLNTMDTWKFYSEGLREKNMLLQDPGRFFGELFYNPYSDSGNVLGTSNSYWNDLKHNIMIKFSALLHLVSNSHYYTNIILYNFLAFFGPMALFRTVDPLQLIGRKLLIFVCFLIPTTAFWFGGFHKEGLLFMAIGLIIFFTQQSITNGWTLMRFIKLACCFALIFVLRNNIIFTLAPAWFLWIVSSRMVSKTVIVYLAGYAVFILIFFLSGLISTKTDLPLAVRERQIDFMALGGNSYVATDTLQASFPGFVKHLPAAADMAFLRPHPGDGGLFYIPFTIENICIILMFFAAVFFHCKTGNQKPLIFFCLAFALGLYLLTGYSITNTGAIIRYKSIALPFLALGLISQIRWPIRKIFNGK